MVLLKPVTGVILEQDKMLGIFSLSVRPLQLPDEKSLRIMDLEIFHGSQTINEADLYLGLTIVGSHMMRNQKTQDRLAT